MFTPKDRERRKRLDDRYSVSDRGIVYSNGLPLKAIDGTGVNIHGERKKIAYLVARAFVPNEECRPFVGHRNGIVSDNRAENLEWRETKEQGRRGKKPDGRMVAQYDRRGERLRIFLSVGEAARVVGLNRNTIRAALDGRLKSAGGYLWLWYGHK